MLDKEKTGKDNTNNTQQGKGILISIDENGNTDFKLFGNPTTLEIFTMGAFALQIPTLQTFHKLKSDVGSLARAVEGTASGLDAVRSALLDLYEKEENQGTECLETSTQE